MTYEQFVERWKYELAGLALYGQYMHSGHVPMSEATKHAMGIPKLTHDLLRRMYSDLCPAKPDPAAVAAAVNRSALPPTNGAAKPTAKI